MERFSKNQLERYPFYLKFLKVLEEKGEINVSSPTLAKELGYSEEQVRKDLQAVSDEAGRPKKGRNIHQLIETLETFLGYRQKTAAVLIGAGHLGGALLNYPYFEDMGLSIVAGFDTDPQKVGKQIGGKEILPLDKLAETIKEYKATIVIVAVPSFSAQEIVDLALKSGALAIWNFAPTHISVPEGIVVENVNLASSLAVLSHRLNFESSKGE
ncbi:MAG: redox-sensing transcriptional repressor Rex [Bacilli bacterium]|jgi:redox-sensing transcriptional repressor|nr:redox-sensing transcriptional repressor Rex [Bacilli bacterium]